MTIITIIIIIVSLFTVFVTSYAHAPTDNGEHARMSIGLNESVQLVNKQWYMCMRGAYANSEEKHDRFNTRNNNNNS